MDCSVLKNLPSMAFSFIDYNKAYFNQKKGSIFVEAAIFLPMLIICVLTFSYFIKVIYFQEEVFNHLVNEGRRISQEASLYELEFLEKNYLQKLIKAGPQNRILFESRINKKLDLGNQNEIQNFKIKEFRFIYSSNQIDELIKIKVNFNVRNIFGKAIFKDFNIQQNFVSRAWSGKTSRGITIPFKKMEEDLKSSIIYLFPRAGERYHSETCSFISSYPFEKILSNEIFKIYSPCALCDSANMIAGEVAYIFKNGKVYHRSNCYKVEKYIISMDKLEAEAKGYLPCFKCKGGN
ncbi:MAG: hypothetical protein WCF96_00275 [Eubacteriales bacterium]